MPCHVLLPAVCGGGGSVQAWEFFDTWIMILKKNTRQISFLHGETASPDHGWQHIHPRACVSNGPGKCITSCLPLVHLADAQMALSVCLC